MRSRRIQKHQREERRLIRKKWMFEKQKGLCFLCGKPMTLDRGTSRHGGPLFATYEHVVPKCEGGASDGGNIKLSHKICNARRGNARIPHALRT